MDLADYFIKEIKKYHWDFMKKKVLRTMEEVEANTDEYNIPSAMALAELSNDLRKIKSEPFTFQNFVVKQGFVRLGTLPAEFESRNIICYFITSSVNLPGPVTITIEHGNELYIYSSVNATVSSLSLKISYTDK